jgi:hypothetical protein
MTQTKAKVYDCTCSHYEGLGVNLNVQHYRCAWFFSAVGYKGVGWLDASGVEWVGGIGVAPSVLP